MKSMPMEQFKEITERYGFNYGPNFWIIKHIWQGDNEGLCLVDISGSPAIQKEAGDYVIHPSILDTCLQSCFVPLGNLETEDTSIVPVGFKSISLSNMPFTKQLYCHVTADATEFGKFDVSLMSPSGKVLLTMSEFRIAELTSTPRRFLLDNLAYEIQWMEDELHEHSNTSPNVTCLVLRESTEFSDLLVTRLQEAKVNVITVEPPNAGCFYSNAEEAITAAFAGVPPSHSSKLKLINMWPVETTLLPNSFEVIDQAQRLAFSSSVFLLKLVIEKEWFDTRLFLITERTQLLNVYGKSPKTNTVPWASTVWGLRRTANLEEFNFRVTAVDLNNKDIREVGSLTDEILGDSIEEEVAFRDGKRFINRVARTAISPEQPRAIRSEQKKKSSTYLSCIPSSRTICLREKSHSKISDSELKIDLLYCWTPSESLIDVSRPRACVFVVGKVTGLPENSGNTQLQIGDTVCGVIASGRISPSLSIQISNVFVKPTSMTEEQAAYIPACLAIAFHALQRVDSGKHVNLKLLIHEANRGPGPAAVALAKTLGHRVFCTISDTCQTSAKALLLEVGAERVVRQSSYGLKDNSLQSFDAVVFFYSPPPNVLQKSNRCLKRGGRVVILSSEFDGDVVIPANANVRYEREDISDILRSPLALEKLTLESLALLEGKENLEKLLGMQLVLSNLTTSIQAANESIDEHKSTNHQTKSTSSISYLIHSFPSPEKEGNLYKIPVLPCGLDDCGLKEDRTYLVAGGLRGFGFEVARWMAENGAKSIGLISRSKPSDCKCQEIREIEERTGAKIYTFQVCRSHS